jgi:hypothetical protein
MMGSFRREGVSNPLAMLCSPKHRRRNRATRDVPQIWRSSPGYDQIWPTAPGFRDSCAELRIGREPRAKFTM